MYTVKQVAALTGVTEATLRVWERRYGVVHPERSNAGYRLYDVQELATLREMARLVGEGVPASRAAKVVRDLDRAVGPESTDDLPAVDALVAAAASLDPVRLDSVIAGALAAGDFEHVADDWLRPQLGLLGAAWESGELTVAQEHFASAALMRAIAAAFEEARGAGDSGDHVPPMPEEPNGTAPVVVGLPAGDRHELALLAFATCLLRRGVEVVYLGADVPTAEWTEVVRQRGARGVVLGVTAEAFVPEAQRVVEQLSHVAPPVVVWVGGSRRTAVIGAHQLPDELARAASMVHLSLVAGGA